MATQNDLVHLEAVDGELQGGQRREVIRSADISYRTPAEYFAGQHAETILVHTRIGARDE